MPNRTIVEELVNKVKWEYESDEYKEFKMDVDGAVKKTKTASDEYEKNIDRANKKELKVKVDKEKIRRSALAFNKIKQSIDRVKMAAMSAGRQISRFGGGLKDLSVSALKIGGITAGIGAGVFYLTEGVAESTVKIDALSQSLGTTAKKAFALGTTFSAIGMGEETVLNTAKMIEKTLGDMSIMARKGVEMSFKAIGVSLKDLTGIPADEKFIRLMEAAQKAEDKTKAFAAISKIAGPQGALMLGYLRNQEQSLSEIVKIKEGLYALDEEGLKGSNALFNEWDDFSFTVDGIKRQFAGMFGNVIAPNIKEATNILQRNRGAIRLWLGDKIEWVNEKVRELIGFFKTDEASNFFSDISKKIGEFVDMLPSAKEGMDAIFSVAKGLAEAFEVIRLTLKGISDIWNKTFKERVAERFGAAVKTFQARTEAGFFEGEVERLKSIKREFGISNGNGNGGNVTVIRRDMGGGQSVANSSVVNNDNRNISISIDGAQSPELVAQQIELELNRRTLANYNGA